MDVDLERHAEQLAALGSPIRLAILRRIVQGDAGGTAVGDIQRRVEIPWSTLSHHLDRLASAGLVATRRDGKHIYYRAQFQTLRALTDYVWKDCCGGGKSCC